MSMPKGLDDLAVEKSLREITAATADILAPLMVRIGIYESDPEKIYEDGKCRGHLPPTVVFNCGPGRSLEAKNMLMNWVTEILSENLGCGKRDVRCHLLDIWEGPHLTIDGKPKDFSKKVKQDALHVQHSDAQRQA